MEDGVGRCPEKVLSKDQMEGGSGGSFEEASSHVKTGAQGHHERDMRQDQMGGILEKEQSEVTEWLSSLSHSHLDLLISLKELAMLRAKNAGCEDVAEKFDPRMLRALGAILMEYLKERIQNASIFSGSSEAFELLSGRRFVAQKHEKDLCQMTIRENIKTSTLSTRKRLLERSSRTRWQSNKRRKAEDPGR